MKEKTKELLARGMEQTDLGMRPSTLEYFVMNMGAFMLLYLSFDGVGQDFLDSKEAVTVKKVIDVLTQADFLHGLKLFMDLHQFLDYLLEQDVTDEDRDEGPFTSEWITDKWNSFAKMKNAAKGKEE